MKNIKIKKRRFKKLFIFNPFITRSIVPHSKRVIVLRGTNFRKDSSKRFRGQVNESSLVSARVRKRKKIRSWLVSVKKCFADEFDFQRNRYDIPGKYRYKFQNHLPARAAEKNAVQQGANDSVRT